ncbi:MAG: phosphate ABC transporter substrate-binding protein, PhoT family, partial [Clostridia bacterium]|nr:phosphate ABC transporter substrate-binding protein, PhoT family [Clostridia bacterium]
MRKTAKQIISLVSIVLVFAIFNGCMYLLLSRRLSNNFSDTSQSKQIDVAKFLPHVPGSDLARIDSSLKLTDNLPVLDGAAALVPVYAAI